VTLAELDTMLDLSVEAFDAGVERLIDRFRRENLRLAMPETGAAGRVRRVQGSRQYHAEIARLPQMDRALEFRMAKRHEFLRRRAERALAEVGFRRDEIAKFAQRSFAALPPWPPVSPSPRAGDSRSPDFEYGRRALADLSRLRNLFLEGALHLVLSTAYRYRNLGVDLADLIQEGNASLFQAIHGFDWRRDVRFRTYAQFWVHQAVLKALYNSSRTVRIPVWVQKALRKAQRLQQESPVPLSQEEIARQLDMPVTRLDEITRLRRGSVSLDATPPGGEESMAQQLPDPRLGGLEPGDEKEIAVRLAEVMAGLPSRERSILNRRYGLHGTEPETLAEIAGDLGISAERVRQLQNAAVARLRQPTSLARLADLS
jgi:RNA polymerase sigma factor (sigma-70 family)